MKNDMARMNSFHGNDSNQEILLHLHRKFIVMLRDIERFCSDYDMKLIPVGGTLLGLVRHNGFIPWDDDVDVALFREDYEKFKQLFDAALGDRYLLTGPNTPNGPETRFLFVYAKDAFLKYRGCEKKQMLKIDVFPIDYVPNNPILRLLKGIYSNSIMAISSSLHFKEDATGTVREKLSMYWKTRLSMGIRDVVSFMFSFTTTTFWDNYLDKMLQGEKGEYVTIAVGRGHYMGEMLETNVFHPLISADFCGVRVWKPQRSSIYLKNLYGGDYMSIPPVECRESHAIEEIYF